MSLVHEADVAGAATHALVIGCGHYPHLPGGGAAQCGDPDGLGQLSSPPLSARTLADWLIDDFGADGQDKPLASVRLLLSEQPPAQYRGQDVTPATAANVAEAVKAWRDHADTDAGHRTIFYFCGHGIAQGTDMALLLADYCADPLNQLDGALDFGKLYQAMNRIKASQQLYFVDACRSSSDTLIEAAGFAGRVVMQPANRAPDLPKRASALYYATLQGDKAYGMAGQPSLFASGLLKALKGAASEESVDDPDVWIVDTAQMKKALDFFLQRPVEKGEQVPVQVPSAGELITFGFYRLPGPPEVPVFVGCEPAADNEQAEFRCMRNGDELFARPVDKVDPEKPDREWEVSLPVGTYEFTAALPSGLREGQRNVRPTHRVVTFT